MDKVYFTQFSVAPIQSNPQISFAKGALAACWVQADSKDEALAKSQFYIRRSGWELKFIKVPPTIVTEHEFVGKDLGLASYLKAKETGSALIFTAWPADNKNTLEPTILEDTVQFDLNAFLQTSKKQRNKGRCLHYNADGRCEEIIDAHSIQRHSVLSGIADEGHVYALSRNFGDLVARRGNLTYSKQGIGKVSTFRGFCKTHDSEVFRPIDTGPLLPTHEQAALYAYRSICRETFAKENALATMNAFLKTTGNNATESLLANVVFGTELALNNLRRHKTNLEGLLKHQTLGRIKYVALRSTCPATAAFSGLLYPDFDFQGRQLQDLGNPNVMLDLITFSSAPTEDGWALIFAWEEESHRSCDALMGSLAQEVRDNEDRVGDLLFWFVVNCCENLAFSPKWWEGLRTEARTEIEDTASLAANIFSPVKPSYLAGGQAGISGWAFESVVSETD